MMTAMRGMAWDHPRALLPLAAVSSQWSERSGVAVEWDARPLKDFEDQPLEELASRYDLLLIDYPFVEVAATSGLIAPVDEWVDAAYLADQAAHSVGPSYASYAWAGRQWALAIDAACQVSAVRDDLWRGTGLDAPPRTWTQVAALAAATRTADRRVAMPLNPNHAYCAFLSIGISIAGMDFWRRGQGFERAAAVEALEFLRHLTRDLHEISPASDPIAISDRMATTDEVLYVPLMFGYSSYARPAFRQHVLRFDDAPRGLSGTIGSVLGGVGIALSAQSRMQEFAADLARTMASAPIQAGLYARAGGQPGHLAAWSAPEVDALVGGFFAATLETIQHAFLRPRRIGHREFQPQAGTLVHGCIHDDAMPVHDCVAKLEQLMAALLPEWCPAGIAGAA
jgi:multiple sugar transport system substrate-binding protein